MFESEADRLALIKSVGGEEFDTGQPEYLWGIFDREFSEAALGEYTVESRRPLITCRTSDVALHELVKDSAIKRVSDQAQFVVKRFEDDGTGMTIVELKA